MEIELYTLTGRLYPTKKQRIKLAQTFGCVRSVYNYYVYNFLHSKYTETEEIITLKNGEKGKKRIYEKPITLGNLKKLEEYSYLKEVDSLALCNTKLDFEKARNEFLSIKEHKLRRGIVKHLQNNPEYKVNLPYDYEKYPRFKKKKNEQSYTTNNQISRKLLKDKSISITQSIEYSDNRKGINKGTIKIPKIGWIKVNLGREFQGNIRHVTITKACSGKYTISVLVDKYNIQGNNKIFKNNEVGIDLGIKSYISDSNGEVIQNPKYLRNQQKRLKREGRKLSRRLKKSGDKYIKTNNYEKQRIKVSRIHEKIKNQRKDFIQKLSNKYICENQTIYLENLNIKGMMKNHKLAQAIQDCSWSMFVSVLEYKAKRYNREIIKVDRFYPSSKTCHVCGYKKEDLKLKDRYWTCPNCGTFLDRDENAAINLLKEGQKVKYNNKNTNNTVGTTEIKACVTTCR